jgi:hypothetical protein
MRALLPLMLTLTACKGDEPATRFGTTLPDDGRDADFDGVDDVDDCDPGDPNVYPGAYDEPGDGVDADCDGTDPQRGWEGTWEVVDLQAMYSSYPILVSGGSEGTMEIDDDGAATLNVQALLDPALIGAPIDVFATVAHVGHVAPLERADQLMVYVDGEVSVPTIPPEMSYADLLCTAEGDSMYCAGTLKALEITLDTEAWF